MSQDTPHDLATPRDGHGEHTQPMTLAKLRHEIRNHHNAIKLKCALIHRQTRQPAIAMAR